MAKPPITTAQFYEALGLAVANWNRVEEAYCDLFGRLVLCALTGEGIGKPEGEGVFILGNVFYSTSNFRGRLELIDHILSRLVFDEALLTEWSAIKNKSGRLYARRNVLAHGVPWAGENSDPEFIRYSIFVANARQHMDYQRICAATPSFFRYAKRVERFAIAATGYLARRKRCPEDATH
jgi:hypothetical protein